MAGVNKVIPFNEICRLYESGKSLPQIEREIGVPRSTVRSRLIGAGYQLRSRADAVRAADGLGSGRRGKQFPHSPERRAAISKARTAWGEANAAGVSLKPSGYIEITRGENKGRSEHVVIVERRIGRRLLPDEIVHHIDGDRANNNIDNLALMTRAAHARLHRREQKLARSAS